MCILPPSSSNSRMALFPIFDLLLSTAAILDFKMTANHRAVRIGYVVAILLVNFL